MSSFVVGQLYSYTKNRIWSIGSGVIRIVENLDRDNSWIWYEVVEGLENITTHNGVNKFHKNSPFAECLIPYHEYPEINSEEFFNLIG